MAKFTGNEVCPKCGATGLSTRQGEENVPNITPNFVKGEGGDPDKMVLSCRVCSYQWDAEPMDAA